MAGCTSAKDKLCLPLTARRHPDLNHGVVFSSRVHDQPHPSLRCHEHAIVRRLVMRPKHQAKATTLDQFRRHLVDHTGLDAIGHVAFAQPIFRAALNLLRC